MQCSGIAIDEEEDLVYEDNVFVGKEFVPGDTATDVVSGYGYEKLTDGSVNNKNGRFSTKTSNTAVLDATLELGGVYKLTRMRFCYYNEAAKAYNG